MVPNCEKHLIWVKVFPPKSVFVTDSILKHLDTAYTKWRRLFDPVDISLFKVNNGNTKAICEICEICEITDM